MLQTGAAGEIGEREKQTSRAEPAERDHFVQFYEDDAFLADAVATFVGGALGAGDGAVVIATPEHRAAIDAVLKGRGLETAGPQARGRFVVLDAGETLAQFMVDGLPDRGRFDEVVGGLMKKATAGLRRVRAFGEMVAILWAQGNRKGAMQLEDFWNELGKECSFSLLCGYPMGSFAEDADGAAFGHICGQHSHVVPAESYGGLAGHDARQLAVTVLRTPLNAIFGWTQIIRQDPADAASVAEGIAVIDRNVRMQTQLIEDLLDMSRIIAGKARMEFQPTELAAVVDAAVEAVRPMAQEHGVALSRMADPLAGAVSGDPVRLRQVVWNLLTNAVKFTPAGGKVEVLVERVNAQVEICVKDTGQGIRPDFLPHVFERFRQADSSTARRHGGLGLGLAIVKQIVELHGGEVRAKSAGEGRGSSFVVSLPLASAKSAESPRVSPMPDGEFAFDRVNMSLKGVRILVVDDEADARDLVSRLLEDYGGEVVAAGSAEEGIGALDVFKPDVLICDIGMPGRDGYQFIRDFRERCSAEGRQVPAIALTAFARSEDRTRALRAGFHIHVSKPIEPRELVVTVCSLARRAKG